MSDKARIEIRETTLWVHRFRGDVNHGAFIKACDDALRAAWPSSSTQAPPHLFGQGLATLDVACRLIGWLLPSELRRYRLPGLDTITRYY